MAKRGAAALIIAFLLIAVMITLADAHTRAPAATPLICKKAYGVKERETCFAGASYRAAPEAVP